MIRRWWSRLDRTGRLLVIALAFAAAAGLACLIAWWDTYWAQYVAQNILPPSFWTLAAVIWAHVLLHRKLDDHHQDMKDHVTATAAPPREGM